MINQNLYYSIQCTSNFYVSFLPSNDENTKLFSRALPPNTQIFDVDPLSR